MRIGELSRRSGLATSHIRFYEANGLLGSVTRRSNGYREFPSTALKALEVISNAQSCGFTLDEIRALLPQPGTMQWDRKELLDRLKKKMVEIARMQRRLASNRKQLQAVIDTIERSPQDIACVENLDRVMDTVRHLSHKREAAGKLDCRRSLSRQKARHARRG